MDARPREIVFYEPGGFQAWLDALEEIDPVAYDSVVARLERVEEGNFGDCDSVGGGVSELRFLQTGPGFRVYFGEHDEIVVILRGGTKKSQTGDIKAAKALWKEYKKSG